MIDVSIIGAGRLGASLGYALSKKKYRIKAFSCLTLVSAKDSQKVMRRGKPSTDNIETARKGKLIILGVPDGMIKEVGRDLAASDLEWSKKFVFHCSGLHPSAILKPLEEKGAWVASFHPVQSFPHKKADLGQFKKIYFGIEGSPDALSLAKKMVQDLGGYSLILDAQDKPLYHAACSVASNFFVVLLDMAISLLERAGFEGERASQFLLPLVQGTLHNVKKFDIGPSLTGPVIRGDRSSVEKHLESLRKYPLYHEMYVNLARCALEIAKREKKLSPKEIRALKNLLEGK